MGSSSNSTSLQVYAARLLEELCSRFPLGYTPTLEWKGLRVTAGLAYYKEGRIVLSNLVLSDEERVRITLMHEYAHLLAVVRHGVKAAGHGRAWKQAMIDLGQAPKVRHSYQVCRNQRRQEVTYRCKRCGLSFARARRLPQNRRWAHRGCGGDLRLESIHGIIAREDASHSTAQAS